MHNVRKYNCRHNNLLKYLKNKNIISIHAQHCEHFERECVNILFNDEIELDIYCFFRIIEKGQIVLGVSDFYYNQNSKLNTINFLEKLKGLRVERVEQKQTGDFNLFLENDICIEILIDVTKTEADFYSMAYKNQYYEVCNFENKLTTISGIHEEDF